MAKAPLAIATTLSFSLNWRTPMMPMKPIGLKGITLNWDHNYRTNKVCLVAVFAPSGNGDSILMTSDCARHQARIEDFRGQVGETVVSTQTYLNRPNDPVTVVHFGLGPRVDFNLTIWRAALTTVFNRTRNYQVFRLLLDLDAIGLGTFLNLKHLDFGRVTAVVARAVLHGAPSVEYVELGIRYQEAETRRMIQEGIDEGFRTRFL
jgi:hypothetical protein